MFIFLLWHILTNSLRVHVLRLTLGLHWDKPEDVMNKVMTAVVVAGGLMLMNAPEAAAHTEVRYAYQSPPYNDGYRGLHHGFYERRSKHMPRWLKRNESFRKWYRHSSLKRNQRLAWGELYDIYRWERRYDHRRYKRYRDDHHYRDHKHRNGRREGRRHHH
jgi:hypothetical protein